MPADKICEKLKASDGQICNIRVEKPKVPVDWSTVVFDKMRVKELKDVLSEWGEKCNGCTDKSDFLALIKKHLPAQIKKQQDAGLFPKKEL